MKRILFTLLLAFMLMMTLGTQVVLAKGPPDSITIVPNTVEWGTIVRIVFSSDNYGPPDVNILTPKGRIVPPNH